MGGGQEGDLMLPFSILSWTRVTFFFVLVFFFPGCSWDGPARPRDTQAKHIFEADRPKVKLKCSGPNLSLHI